MRKAFGIATACLAFALVLAPTHLRAESRAALAGRVSSPQEGAMEGVVVSAKRLGSTVTVSVVSDKNGRYSFPADRLEPGRYLLSIRAIGYDLNGEGVATIAPQQTANADLALKKTKNIVSQLSNAEWLESMPGTEAQKSFLLNCLGCHTLERVARSTHNAEEWAQTIVRMMGYAPTTLPSHPQRVMDEARAGTPEKFRKQAEWLATVNLSTVSEWEYPLKTFARPTGQSTHVIITEYDLPRPTIQPHDVLVDAQGKVWYTDFGSLHIGRYDPHTGKLKEFALPQLKPGYPVGNLDLEQAKDGTLWFDMMFQAAIGNLDPKTEKLKIYPLPAAFNDNRTQLNFLGLRPDIDGKVWTKNVGTQDVFRVDLASGKFERFQPLKQLQGGPYSIYQIASDSHNNLYFAEFSENHIGRIDAKTGEVKFWETPTPHSRVRRLKMDDQDRLFFTEYRGNRVGMFDTRTEKITEWQMPTPWTGPYRAAFAANGEVWTAGMNSDRVVRLDPKTGATVEYQLPHVTNIRSVFLDKSTPGTFWAGNNHGAALVKLEPLD